MSEGCDYNEVDTGRRKKGTHMLVLDKIGWQLPEGDEILKNITLEVPDGKMTVVTGPNGG